MATTREPRLRHAPLPREGVTMEARGRIIREQAGGPGGSASAEEEPSTSSEVGRAMTPRTEEDEGAPLLEILEAIPGVQIVHLEDEPPHEDICSPG
jgi:hypothetical protein